MNKYKEIENKWSADHVLKTSFLRKIKKLFQDKSIKYKLVKTEGPDYYYSNKQGYALRHRSSADTNELTLKLREDKNSTTIRKEVNVLLAKQTTVLDVKTLLNSFGFFDDIRIHKKCYIFYFKSDQAEVDIVWYKVTSPKRRPKVFLEVEVNHVDQQKSLKILKEWSDILEKTFKLKEKTHMSLYEIYSGKKYKTV